MTTRARKPRTGAEKYLSRRMSDPEYAAAYDAASSRIAQIDNFLRTIDARRSELGLTKAELARRAGLKPAAIRRLLTSNHPNPTLTTLIAIAESMDLAIAVFPESGERKRTRKRSTASRSGAA